MALNKFLTKGTSCDLLKSKESLSLAWVRLELLE